MSISELKKLSLQKLKGNWGKVVGLTFIVFLLSVIIPTIIEIVVSGGFQNWMAQQDGTSKGNPISSLISILLVPFSVSVMWFYLSFVRGENPEVLQTFSIYKDGKTALRVIGAYLLQAIFTVLWMLLFIIPGIIKALSYSQTYYLLKDHPEYTVIEAITESRKRMNGHKGQYFLLGLSFIGWGILCGFTLGIGLLWLVPYMNTTMANFYNEVIATKEQSSVSLSKE